MVGFWQMFQNIRSLRGAAASREILLLAATVAVSCAWQPALQAQEKPMPQLHTNWRMVKLSDLPTDDQILWNKFHRGMVGEVKLDSPCYRGGFTAKSLIRREGNALYQVVDVHMNNGRTARIFGPTKVVSPFVIWKKYTRKLEDVDGKRWPVNQEALIIEKMESVSYTYACIGNKRVLIQTTG